MTYGIGMGQAQKCDWIKLDSSRLYNRIFNENTDINKQ